MANDTTSERIWSFTTATGGDIADAGTPVIIRAIEYRPASVDDDVVIQEYDSAGSARTGITLKANHAAAEPIWRDYGFRGRRLNGFNLSTIDGGTLYVYLGED
jgi:hypothetical protein